MADDHDLVPDEIPEDGRPDEADYDDYPLLSAEDFDGELEALEAYAAEDESDVEAALPYEDVADDAPPPEDDHDAGQMDEAELVSEPGPEPDHEAVLDDMDAAREAARRDEGAGADLEAWDDDERLRQPRALTFRRRLRNQISMLPLALFLLALGAYLIAREQDVGGLPDFSTLALAAFSVLAVGFTAVFHSLLSGRRERGLLALGVWIWVTAGLLAVLVYGIDEHPDAAEWWPLLLWSLGVTLLVTYVIERTHDVRLVLLSVLVLVAGASAYWVTSDRIADRWLDTAADYWPLVLSIVGVGLLPLAFRRRGG